MSGAAWVLNLDADDELAALGRGARYVPRAGSAALRARVRASIAALGPLVRDGVVLGEANVGDARGLVGRAFCPTPSAIAALVEAGATPPRVPAIDVLVRANHRRFSAEVGQTLAGGTFVDDERALEAAFAREARGREWVLKHPHGYVGRNRHRTFALDAATRSFAARAIAEAGGLQLEPWVARTDDYALHGFVADDGAVTLGVPTRQICDGRGVWQASSRETDLSPAERASLAHEAEATARALASIGYFGPFGIDAFRYAEGKRSMFCARCEVNARYTMGYGVGMGANRPDLA